MQFLNFSDLSNLVASQAAESQRLEFKATLPGRQDRDRHEFLKDVVALANADGGSIVYGILEKNGIAAQLAPLSVEDRDFEDRRLLQMMDAGIEPRIASARMQWINSPDGAFLVISIEKSYAGPHRFTVNGQSKFVFRNNTHVTEMTYSQLASSFARANSQIETLDQDWDRWCNVALSGKTFRPISGGPVIVCGFVPVVSSEKAQITDLNLAYSRHSEMMGSGWGGASSRFTYDGLAVFSGHSEPTLSSLSVISRFGPVISYENTGHNYNGNDIMSPDLIAKIIIERIKSCVSFGQKLNIGGPFYIYCSIIRMNGYRFITTNSFREDRLTNPPMDSMNFPKVWIDDADAELDVDDQIRPWMDLMWQTVGFSQCPHYDEAGKFVIGR